MTKSILRELHAMRKNNSTAATKQGKNDSVLIYLTICFLFGMIILVSCQ